MGCVSGISNTKTTRRTNKPGDSCRITFGVNGSLQLILPQNICLMLFSHPEERAVDAERKYESLFGVFPHLEVVLSLRCQVIFSWVWQQLWKHVGGWRKCSSSVNSVPPLLRQTHRKPTAPHFLNSSVKDGWSHTEKTAQLTPTTTAAILPSCQKTNIFRISFKCSTLVNNCQSEGEKK